MQSVMRDLIRRYFDIHVNSSINGEMNGFNRQKIIDKFIESEGFNALILSPKAAGVGFTITSANHVIHLQINDF